MDDLELTEYCANCIHLINDNLCRNHKDKPKNIYIEIPSVDMYICGNWVKK